MSTVRVIWHVQDPQAHPIGGALLSAQSTHGPWQGVTDVNGDFHSDLTPGHYEVTIAAIGFQTRLLPADIADPGTITIGLARITSSVPAFTVSGHNFIDDNGKRVVICGTDGFCDLRLLIDGGPQALDPFAAESAECRFTGRRIWLMGDASDNQVMTLYPQRTPGYFGYLQELVGYWNARGVVPLLDCIINGSLVMPNTDEQILFWNQVNASLPPSQFTYIQNGGNEWSHAGAGFNPNQWPPLPAPTIWSRASDQQDGAVPPNGAPTTCFHQRRDVPKTLDDAVASATHMQYVLGFPCAFIMDEGYKFDENSSPELAWQLGHLYSTLWAMAVFHNFNGQRGQLMGPNTKRCAKEFSRGMTLL